MFHKVSDSISCMNTAMNSELNNTMSPLRIILLGITGDLAQKKLLPALYDLFVHNLLPYDTCIIGFSRRPFTDSEIKTFVSDAITKNVINSSRISEFVNLIKYVQGEYNIRESYIKLEDYLRELDALTAGQCSNKIFFLSVPPTLYEEIATHISESGLATPCMQNYTRILVEKPFGQDIETAKKLVALFNTLFAQDQVFRIDHYLAKKSLYSIVSKYRIQDDVKKVWNKNFINKVEINLFETNVVGGRGPYYDAVGALRDVGQNHLLQMLALVALTIPEIINAENLQKARAEVFAHLVPLTVEEMQKIKRGQYDGYLSELGVNPASTTETFFSLTTYVDAENFSHVPFMLTSGKALDKNLSEIKIYFKDGTEKVFTVAHEDSLGAYEKVFLDCIAGDQTIFTSTEEVLGQWEFITPIVSATSLTQPFVYQKGTDSAQL